MYEGVRNMQEKQSSRDVNARTAVEAVRGNMTNHELMERFKISPRGFADLLKQLFEKKLISEEDMVRRGIRFRILKAQAEIEPEVPEPAPAPKPKIATPPAPKTSSSRAKASSDDEEEFLDTVELTKLFTTFGPTQHAAPEQAPQEISQPQEEPKQEDAETTEKKNKFSITGFFKRGR